MLIKSFSKYFENKIIEATTKIIDYLSSQGFTTYDDLLNLPRFDRDIINIIIDENCTTMREVNELKFLLRLKLSNMKELQSMLKEYEDIEDYAKCHLISQQIKNL
jgi:hypothetical protein